MLRSNSVTRQVNLEQKMLENVKIQIQIFGDF